MRAGVLRDEGARVPCRSRHSSILALVEKRFSLPSLTARDANASDLEDMFDFDSLPSARATIGTAPLAMQPGDPNCPFATLPSRVFAGRIPLP